MMVKALPKNVFGKNFFNIHNVSTSILYPIPLEVSSKFW